MVKFITKAQRKALKKVFDRAPIFANGNTFRSAEGEAAVTYRQFRRSVQGTFGCDGAVMVPWAGMWLGIERDGYTHS